DPEQPPHGPTRLLVLRSRHSPCTAAIRDAAGYCDAAPGEVGRLVRPRECSGRLFNRENLATPSQPEDESVRGEQRQVWIDIDPDASVDDPQGVARRRVQRVELVAGLPCERGVQDSIVERRGSGTGAAKRSEERR